MTMLRSLLVSNPVMKPMFAICIATHSQWNWRSLNDTTLKQLLIPSISETVSVADRSKYEFRLYLAADHDDDFWLRNQKNLQTPDWLSVHIGFYNVPESKIPFNPMMRAAYNDGAEYMVRINDNSECVTPDWVSIAVAKLASYEPANVGMVGPNAAERYPAHMSHDMVHRTHLDIFEHYYPDIFSAWWLVDWISRVYGEKRSTKLMDWRVKHHWNIYSRHYEVQRNEEKLLKEELDKGKTKIGEWLEKQATLKQLLPIVSKQVEAVRHYLKPSEKLKPVRLKTLTLAIPAVFADLLKVPALLSSIESQTMLPDEVVYVVSGVTKCPNISNWKVICVRNRLKAGSARNIAWNHSTSELVSFFDADDLLYPERLEVILRNFDDDMQLLLHEFSPVPLSQHKMQMSPPFEDGGMIYDAMALTEGKQLYLHSKMTNGHVTVRRDVDCARFVDVWGEDSIFVRGCVKRLGRSPRAMRFIRHPLSRYGPRIKVK